MECLLSIKAALGYRFIGQLTIVKYDTGLFCSKLWPCISLADAFRGIYRDRPEDAKFTFPNIHVYGFSKARDPEFDFHMFVN